MDQSCLFLLDAPKADAADSWVQVAKAGSFSDPRYGKFKITTADFSRWIKNFNSFSLADGRLGLPVDVDHSPEKKGDTEAFGWVKQLEQRGQELWARVEWNPAGKELIAERRYAYISPSYSADYKDETGTSHGTALVGIALTNRPFLQMATVNLSSFTFAAVPSDNDADDQPLPDGDVSDLDEATDLDDGTDLDNLVHTVLIPRAVEAGHITPEQGNAIRERLGNSGRQHSSYNPPRDAEMELNQILTALNLSRETLGVAADADDATTLAALTARQAKPEVPAGHVLLSQDAVTTLQAQAAQGAAAAEELRITKFETAFLSAQEEGKVTLGQKQTFREMYDLNGDTALKLLSELQPVVSMRPEGHGQMAADLDPIARSLAKDYQDEVTPLSVDTEGLKTVAKAEAIALAKNISFERALALVEQGVEA